MTKVLVVEDEPSNTELMREILSAKGFDTDEAENGVEAIEKAKKRIYDLILMDIGLPDMEGIEVMKIIRGMPGYKNVPVIAITSYVMKGDKERFLETGFNDYISKPIDVAGFMKILGKYRK